MSERVADYFAACALMPKAWVKTAFYSRTQRVEELADLFQVSPRAMSVRLSQLGLTTPVDRCERRISPSPLRQPSRFHRYHRAASTNYSAAAGIH